jgi:hypothetical protein
MIVLLIEHILKVDKHENNTIFVELININKSTYCLFFVSSPSLLIRARSLHVSLAVADRGPAILNCIQK